jgi:hypothetical protein
LDMIHNPVSALNINNHVEVVFFVVFNGRFSPTPARPFNLEIQAESRMYLALIFITCRFVWRDMRKVHSLKKKLKGLARIRFLIQIKLLLEVS